MIQRLGAISVACPCPRPCFHTTPSHPFYPRTLTANTICYAVPGPPGLRKLLTLCRARLVSVHGLLSFFCPSLGSDRMVTILSLPRHLIPSTPVHSQLAPSATLCRARLVSVHCLRCAGRGHGHPPYPNDELCQGHRRRQQQLQQQLRRQRRRFYRCLHGPLISPPSLLYSKASVKSMLVSTPPCCWLD